MKRKNSSKLITLVLIGSLLAASCSNKEEEKGQQVYMRADGTAPYSQSYAGNGGSHTNGMLTGALMYHAFSSFGRNTGYQSSSISERSNLGTNSAKTSVYAKTFSSSKAAASHSSSRGGFGKSSFSSGS